MENLRRKPVAVEYMSLTNHWLNAEKETIVSNVERILCDRYPECEAMAELHKMLMFMTDSGKHTVYAWLNRSREDVKIPLLKLCMIADELHIDVMEFLR